MRTFPKTTAIIATILLLPFASVWAEDVAENAAEATATEPAVATTYHERFGGDWERLHDRAPFGPREYTRAVSFKDRIYVTGGHNYADGWLNDVWSSPDGVEWTMLTGDAGWKPRNQHGVVGVGDRLYVMGGSGWELYNDVWSSADGVEWREETPNAPWDKRSEFAFAEYDDRMWVLGGYAHGVRRNDVWASSDGANWELVAERAPWRTRSSHVALNHDGRLYVMGGGFFHFANDRHYYMNDVWSTTDGVEWRCDTGDAAWGPRILHQAASSGGAMWLVGGDEAWYIFNIRRDTFKSTDGANWTEVGRAHRGNRFTRRGSFTMVAHRGALHLFGGMDYVGFTYWPVQSYYQTPPREYLK